MLRRLALGLVLTACVPLLAGCVAIQSVTGAQQDVVGDVRVTAVDDDMPAQHPGCTQQSAIGEAPSPSEAQLLLGLRVPVGTEAPEVVTGTTNETPSRTIQLTRDPSYEAGLTASVLREGQRWIGYRSEGATYDAGPNGTPARAITVAVDLRLPRSADGAPYAGALPVVPVVGARLFGGAVGSADRPVVCSQAIGGGADNTVCIDHPLEASIDAAYNFPTRDFGIVAGNATASAGQTVALPFNVRGAGALPAGLTASLTASTTLPGAGAAPSVGSAPLSNGSDTRVTVPVAIPAGAAAGTYEVVLTGRLENGQERRGVAQLTVRPRPVVADTTKPALSRPSVKPKRFKAATRRKRKRGTDVRFTLSEAARVKLTVERCAKRAGKRKRGRCVRFKALKGSLTRPGVAGANKLRFDGRLRGRALKPGAYRLVVTPTDAAGNRGAPAKLGFAIVR